MKQFRHIVAPTDFSPESLSVVRYAAHLARAQRARLTLVHAVAAAQVLFPYEIGIDAAVIVQRIEAAAGRSLQTLAAKYTKSGIPTTAVVRSGLAVDVVCDVADAVHASVIVMATHGRSGLGHVLLGSVAEQVLRSAPCPVLVVKPKAPVIHARKAA